MNDGDTHSLGDLPTLEILEGIEAGSTAGTAGGDGTHDGQRILLQEFRPLAQCLEWELASLYWRREGLSPFAEQRVPYTVNNSGWAAANAAEVLFVACEGFPAGERIEVLELGAGLGLFARLLLDAFRRRCSEAGADYYDRLRYHVTDGSATTVEQWKEHRLFEGHGERVVGGACDAREPLRCTDGDGREHALPRPLAVFANYVLDNLPAAVVRRADGRFEQLHLRTWFPSRHAAELQSRCGLSVAQLVDAASGSEKTGLIDATTFFEVEAAFREVDPDGLPYLQEAAEDCAGGRRAMLSHGAIRCLEACLGRLRDGGFVWVNDVGTPAREELDRQVHVSRFGASVAANLNFPLIERVLSAAGYEVLEPPGDERRSIHARLIGRRPPAALREAFLERYRRDADRPLDRLPVRVTEHIAAGRHSEALDELRAGLALCPEDWNLLANAAQFFNQQLLRHEEARELARRAAARNPWFSSFVWNTLGNCEFCLGDDEEAHRCYERARQIDPGDPQSHLNLAYTLERRGRFGAALASIGRALRHDAEGRFESVLLEKQREILRRLAARRAADDDRLREREERISLAR